MRRGHIALISAMDEIVKRRRYTTRRMKYKILDGWKKEYGKNINKCYIQLIPDTSDRVNEETGMNMNIKKRNL